MKPTSCSIFALLTIGMMFAGCASYAPSLVKLNPSGPNVAKMSKGDLTVYVEEYATPEQSQRAFDTDLANERVLPLLIAIENHGQQSYAISGAEMAVRGSEPLPALTPEEAAGRAGRSAVGRAIGWSLIVPIVAIPVAVAASAMHTSNVNQQIVQDFTAKAFLDGEIMPNKERSGFLFFELKEDTEKDLAGLTFEMTAKNVANGETVNIAVPLPKAVLPLTAEADEHIPAEYPGAVRHR